MSQPRLWGRTQPSPVPRTWHCWLLLAKGSLLELWQSKLVSRKDEGCGYLNITRSFSLSYFLSCYNPLSSLFLRLLGWPSSECSWGWLGTVGPESQQFWR